MPRSTKERRLVDSAKAAGGRLGAFVGGRHLSTSTLVDPGFADKRQVGNAPPDAMLPAVRFRQTSLPDAILIGLEPHEDERGFFARIYCAREFAAAGLPTSWPQCNLSRNVRAATLRGMHYNAAPHHEAKVVRCVSGAVWDAIVDLRPGFPPGFAGSASSCRPRPATPSTFRRASRTASSPCATGATSSIKWGDCSKRAPPAGCAGTIHASASPGR